MELKLSPSDYACGIFDSSYTFPGVKITKPRNVVCYEIELYYESGGITYVDGAPHRIKRGAVLCVKPGTVRYSELPLKTYYVKLNAEGEMAKAIDEACGYFVSENVEKGIDLFFSLLKSCEGEVGFLRHARLLEFLGWVCSESEKAKRISGEKGRIAEAVELGAEYMETHFKERCTLEEISAHAHLSPVYFHKIFTSSVGKTPYEYLTRLRLDESKKLILLGGFTMAEIAEQCGFSSQSYFNSVFKQKMGETPGAYRRRILEGYFKNDGVF